MRWLSENGQRSDILICLQCSWNSDLWWLRSNWCSQVLFLVCLHGGMVVHHGWANDGSHLPRQGEHGDPHRRPHWGNTEWMWLECSSSPLNHVRSLTPAGCLSLLVQFGDESMETNYNAVGNRVKQVSLWFVNREQLLLLIFPGPGRQPGLNVETSLMLLLFGMLVALWLTNAEALIWTRGTILSGWLLILGTSYGLCGLGIALPRPECHLFWRCPPPYHLQR